jgi:hypothetical protein
VATYTDAELLEALDDDTKLDEIVKRELGIDGDTMRALRARFDGTPADSTPLKRTTGHDAAGRFTVGNAGGPGRPPRATERVYLAALADCVTPADWRLIVERAKSDALAGDAVARAWLTKHLLGDGLTLTALAVSEALDIDAADEIAGAADAERESAGYGGGSHADALRIVESRQQAAERERRRAVRLERKARKDAAPPTVS